jgi:hypothetical protein
MFTVVMLMLHSLEDVLVIFISIWLMAIWNFHNRLTYFLSISTCN